MTSRFRSNWVKEGSQSNSLNFDSGPSQDSHHSIDDEFGGEFYCNDCPDDDVALEENNDRGIFRERSLDNRNGKLRDRGGPGMSHYVDDREFDDDQEKRPTATASYHRSSCREDFRFRGDVEVEDYSQRERRAPIGKKSTTSSFAIGSSITRYNLAESANDEDNFEPRLTSTSLMTTTTTTTTAATTTNGNSSISVQTSNGSTKQVKRIEPRRDHHRTIGSLTRGERPVIEDLSIVGANLCSNDVTNRTPIRTNESLNGSKRGRSVNRTSRDDRNDELRSPTRTVCKEIDDYGPIDRSGGMRNTRDRSYSPIERVANGSNGDSLDRRSDRRRKESRSDDRFYSPDRRFDDDEVFHSLERRSRRHADGRSYSPTDNNNGRLSNGSTTFSTNRSQSRDKHQKVEMVGSASRRLSREDDNFDGGNGIGSHGTSRTQGENGSSKKCSDIDDDKCQTKKGSSGRKNHTRYKASPEEFDVQIHRYERALRVPRRDSDLSRKTSFKSQESDLSRKSSFEDHQRSKDSNSSRNKNHHKHRSSELTRGSSEDRDDERASRKNSRYRETRDADLTRKSSLTSRNLLDTGPGSNNNNSSNNHHNNKNNNNSNIINNNHNGKNGSHNRERSESLRRDHDSSITRRRPSRCNDDDDEDDDDYDKSSWKNDRHSRPLTPPKLINMKDRNDSRDRRSRTSCSSLKERSSQNEQDDFARNYVQDHNDCRSKKNSGVESSLVPQGHDRFSSSTRRVGSTRSLNDTRQDNSNGRNGARTETAISGKQSTRELVADDEDPCEDDDNLSFSTIERNGTTVIRICTNSQSPVGQTEPRTRRRTSHRDNVTATRYRKYEDEAEDEDEDDETFGRNYRRRDYRVGPRRLWTNRDGGVQITDLDEGQPCLLCGETCPGFSPHSWRKNCTSCKCPREAHDVCHEEWVSVRARLGLKGEGPNNYVGFDPRDRGLTWAPPGLPPSKVEEYFSMLPEISVPRIGTPGERHRDRQLATQLPKQDLARAYCRHLDSQHSASADDFMAARNEIALDIGSVKEILERGHNCGVCHEPLKYGSLVVSASKLGFSYHPSCFQCTQCRELLVDLAYCVHDDALYCERHYAEQLKPRCAACDELIFSGEYTKAMNKDWHSGHFCCWQCDESLTGQRYVLRDEHPYCIKCYESVFANGCEECNKIIGIDSKDLSYKDKHWHEACFLCNKCRVSLVDKQFGSKVDKIYCGNCYDAQFASRCDGCGEIFRAGTKKMEYKTRQWHEKCFCCVVCRNPIGTKSFIPREQEIYCAGCYEDKFATRCVKCNKIITSGGVTYKNEPWHRDCFTCSNCNNSLAGQRFTSRDDKPYCAECFGELFAKRCTACTRPITGIGGTRFISFEDRHWHNNCFICAGCNTSLVGRGFITDGDDIICPECAKQKLSE